MPETVTRHVGSCAAPPPAAMVAPPPTALTAPSSVPPSVLTGGSAPLGALAEITADLGLPFAFPARPAPRDRAVKVSVVVPVFNEEATVAGVVEDLVLLRTRCELEVVVVDDGSTDRTAGILDALRHPRLRVLRHRHNQGKGAALSTGMRAATGTHLLPFDADSEYDANDIPRLVEPLLAGRADVVYGARIPGLNTMFSSCWYPVGSWLTTWAANAMFSARLKDLHTCLKLVPLPIATAMPLGERGFGLDTELTARLLKMGLRPFEVPVSYHGRTREQGKKINSWDGLRCLLVLLRVRLSRSAPSRPPESYRWAPSRRGAAVSVGQV